MDAAEAGHNISGLPPLWLPAPVPDDAVGQVRPALCCGVQRTVLVFRFWDEFNGVLIEYGTLQSPQCQLQSAVITFARII